MRIVVASNANLQELTETRRFRKDLLYRINVLTLNMPALRERGEDALELARIFLTRLGHHYDRPQVKMSLGSLAYVRSHTWPGNVRELENAVHRALLLSDGDDIDLSCTQNLSKTSDSANSRPVMFKTAKQASISEFEKQYVSQLLQNTNGNLTQAAVLAGLDRSAFGRLVRKHKLSAK